METTTPIKGDKKVINAWAMYDWANSVYNLVITTAIFPAFYTAVTSTDEDGSVVNFFGVDFESAEIYSYVGSFSLLVVAFLMPVMSGMADYGGKKKFFLRLFCYIGAFSCGALYFFDPDHIELSMVPVFLASVGFWMSFVFYNSFLPEIAEPKDHDRVSARGFSMGYLGSSILLIICLLLIQMFDVNARWAFVLTAAWWIGFSQIPLKKLPDNVYRRKPKGNILTQGFKELRTVWAQAKEIPLLKRFLLAFFMYGAGVQTIMFMATIFASERVNMEQGELIISVLLIQFVAIGGAYLFSKASSNLGNIKVLMVSVIVWIFCCLAATQITEVGQFYVLAGVVGVIMGGTQSISRSAYSKMIPETQDHASFFSFYDVTEKIALVVGTFSFGFAQRLLGGDLQYVPVVLAGFFILGLVFLFSVLKISSLKST